MKHDINRNWLLIGRRYGEHLNHSSENPSAVCNQARQVLKV